MPVAKGPSFDLRSAAIFGGVALLAAVVIGFIAIELGRRSNTLVLGDTSFQSIDAQNLSDEIADSGPVLFPDIASGTRDIWVQHLGETPGDGWTAFDARQPGEGRECSVVWRPADRTFESPCDGTVYPETGEGLPEIAVFLDVRELIIDINGIHSADDFVGFVDAG